ncbi:hypothetical protein N7490_010836 [Penicillium lividum]|nr:hypothetical protein N7490_010836 [Penicillium lividum]
MSIPMNVQGLMQSVVQTPSHTCSGPFAISECQFPTTTKSERRKRTGTPDSSISEPAKRQKRQKTGVKQLNKDPFTDEFFKSMANTIGKTFPIGAFAQEKECSPDKLFEALSAVVLAPLLKTQVWHGANSVSEYAQTLIDEWRASTSDSDSTIDLSHPSMNKVLGKKWPDQQETPWQPKQGQSVTKKSPAMPRIIPTDRVEVRHDIYGSKIRADKWIDGFHKPPVAASDEVSDEELQQLLAEGWFP